MTDFNPFQNSKGKILRYTMSGDAFFSDAYPEQPKQTKPERSRIPDLDIAVALGGIVINFWDNDSVDIVELPSASSVEPKTA